LDGGEVSETFDLRIDSIAAGGDGVGRRDGMVVFVPRTAPGDLARVRAERQDRLMRGRLLELVSPSPQRVVPPCKHYVDDRCGGCQVQHLLYEGQVDAKAGIIRDALTRIGRVTAEKPDMEASEIQWRYRRKLTLALRPKNGRWIAGLHRFDTSDVFELEDCLITDQRVLEAWSQVLAQQQLLPSANELRGAVRVLESGFSFVLEGAHDWPSRAEFFAAVPSMMELWWKPVDKGRRLLDTRTGNDSAGASFVQVNPAMAIRLREWVASLAMEQQPRTAVDAYAGIGDIAVALAERGTKVTAIEIDRDAARVAAARLPDGSIAVAAPVEKALPRALPADIVILNPPRAGVDQKVTDVLNGESPKPRAVIYVSCNPATLARDVRRLEGYRVRSVRGFDMFPQTAHVETVCELVPDTSDVSSVGTSHA
jgi:23S rRNA (uracil1939-C5)-methyltransferase